MIAIIDYGAGNIRSVSKALGEKSLKINDFAMTSNQRQG